MEKLKPLLLSLALIMSSILFVGFMPAKADGVNSNNAAQETETTTFKNVQATSIAVTNGNIKVQVLKTKQLLKKKLFKKYKKGYVFYSLNKDVATVTSKGKIKGIAVGTTKILIKKQANVYGIVTVKVKGLKVSKTLYKGDKIKIKKVSKKLKKMGKTTNYIYKASNKKIKVTKKGVIKAKKKGNVTLYVYRKTVNNDSVKMRKFAKIKIKVKKPRTRKGKLIGRFQLTAYCSCYECSEGWGTSTSSGAPCRAGRTVACNSIKAGTHIIIRGHEYVVEDTGGMADNVIDIYFDNHSATTSFGRKFDVPVYYAK